MSFAALLPVILLSLGDVQASELSQTQPPKQPAAVEAAPQWSIVAGVGFGFMTSSVSTGFLAVESASNAPGALTATTTLERALSPRTWLEVDLSAAFDRVNGSGSAAGQSIRSWGIFADAGIRRVLTPPGAPVDLSAVALLGGGINRLKQSLPTSVYGEGAQTSAATWKVGLSGGIAVDRALAPGLFVRISTPLIYASYTHVKNASALSPDDSADGFGAGVRIAPRLELRLAF